MRNASRKDENTSHTYWGNRSRQLVADVVRLSKRTEPFEKIKSQKSLAYALFQADDPKWEAGHSKIDNALKKRCGPPTYLALLDRAIELKLLPTRGASENDPDFYEPHIEALLQLAGRYRG